MKHQPVQIGGAAAWSSKSFATQLAPASPVFSWLVVSLAIVIWPSKIAQLEA